MPTFARPRSVHTIIWLLLVLQVAVGCASSSHASPSSPATRSAKATAAVASATSASAQAVPNVDAQRYRQLITTLADPAMEGRSGQSEGAKKAQQFIEQQFADTGLKKPFGESYLQPFSIASGLLGKTATSPTAPAKSGSIRVSNIAALLPGEGRLASEVIVIGAHYDHVGFRDSEKGRIVYCGADDNASGACGVLTLANWFAKRCRLKNAPANRRTLLFAAFAGEEVGLLGSRYMATHPETLAGRKVVAMINLDMIGRLDGRIWAWGIDGSDWRCQFVRAAAQRAGMRLQSLGTAFFLSDHMSFYLRNIPALTFSTGLHRDVHKPTDTADKINFSGAVRVLRMMQDVIEQAWVAPSLPPPVSTSQPASQPTTQPATRRAA